MNINYKIEGKINKCSVVKKIKEVTEWSMMDSKKFCDAIEVLKVNGLINFTKKGA